MCCFLSVHSWHSFLPYSFFNCDFFSLLRFNSEAKGLQPAKSHRSSLAQPQKALALLCSEIPFSHSHSPCMNTFTSPLALSYVALFVFVVVSFPFIFRFVCLYWSDPLSNSLLFLVYCSSEQQTLFAVSLSQKVEWLSHRSLAGLHTHMALNLSYCMCCSCVCVFFCLISI